MDIFKKLTLKRKKSARDFFVAEFDFKNQNLINTARLGFEILEKISHRVFIGYKSKLCDTSVCSVVEATAVVDTVQCSKTFIKTTSSTHPRPRQHYSHLLKLHLNDSELQLLQRCRPHCSDNGLVEATSEQ